MSDKDLNGWDDSFYDDNEDYLRKRREELDESRTLLESEKSQESFWLRCPKCGCQMHEYKLLEIIVEQCENCRGLFFDDGELETLLQISDRRGFFKQVKKTFYEQ